MKKKTLITINIIIICTLLVGMNFPSDEKLLVEIVKPIKNNENVKIQSRIEIIFNNKILKSDVNKYTFRLNDGIQDVKGKLVYISELKKVIFIPSNNLKKNTIYEMTVFKGIRNIYGNYLKNDYIWNFSTGKRIDKKRPFVTNVFPEDNQENINLNESIFITFSEPVKKTVINSLSVYNNKKRLKGKYFLNKGNTVLVFKPRSKLIPNKKYDIVLRKFYDKAGNSSPILYKWKFKTRYLPRMIYSLPENKGRKILPTTKIVIRFNKELNFKKFNDDTVKIIDRDGNFIKCSYVYNNIKNEFFIKSDELKNSNKYLVLLNNIKDKWGNSAKSPKISFNTINNKPPKVVRYIPEDKDDTVKLNGKVIIEFNEDMNILSLNERTVIVSTKNGKVKGKYKYNKLSRVLTFSPENGLKKGISYRVAVTTDIENEDGIRLELPVYFGFKTMPYSEEELIRKVSNYTMNDEVKSLYAIQKMVGIPFYEKYAEEELSVENSIKDNVKPVIIDSYPENNMKNVPIDTSIYFVFSEELLRETINETTIRVFSKFGNVEGYIKYDKRNFKCEFKPKEKLQSKTIYNIRLTPGITDIMKNELKPQEFKFYTGDSIDSETIAVIPKIKELKYEDPVYDTTDSEIYQVLPESESLKIAKAKEELFYETQVDFSRREWALSTVKDLQWKYSPGMSLDLNVKTMNPKRYELATVIRNILKNMSKGRYNYLYRRKWGILELIKIEQIVVEFELELKNMGVDYISFENSLKKIGIPVLKIREDMNRGIIKISAVNRGKNGSKKKIKK